MIILVYYVTRYTGIILKLVYDMYAKILIFCFRYKQTSVRKKPKMTQLMYLKLMSMKTSGQQRSWWVNLNSGLVPVYYVTWYTGMRNHYIVCSMSSCHTGISCDKIYRYNLRFEIESNNLKLFRTKSKYYQINLKN